MYIWTLISDVHAKETHTLSVCTYMLCCEHCFIDIQIVSMHFQQQVKLWKATLYHFTVFLCYVAHFTLDCALEIAVEKHFSIMRGIRRKLKEWILNSCLVRNSAVFVFLICQMLMLMTKFAGNISSLFFVILRWSLSSFGILNLTTFFHMIC